MMKRHIASIVQARCVSILLVLILLLFLLPFQAFASGEDSRNEELVTLNGTFEGTFDLSGNKSDLFHLENISPGDSWTGKIQIKNEAPGNMGVRLLSISSNIADLTLYDALILNISINKEPLYSGSYNTHQNFKPESLSPLYDLAPGEEITLDIKVALPTTVGNEIQNKKMDSTWTIEAYYMNPADKPQTGNNLMTANTISLFVLFIFLLAIIVAVKVYLRIRAVKKEQAAQVKEVRNIENS